MRQLDWSSLEKPEVEFCWVFFFFGLTVYHRHLRFLNCFFFLFLAGHCTNTEKVGMEEGGQTLASSVVIKQGEMSSSLKKADLG